MDSSSRQSGFANPTILGQPVANCNKQPVQNYQLAKGLVSAKRQEQSYLATSLVRTVNLSCFPTDRLASSSNWDRKTTCLELNSALAKASCSRQLHAAWWRHQKYQRCRPDQNSRDEFEQSVQRTGIAAGTELYKQHRQFESPCHVGCR